MPPPLQRRCYAFPERDVMPHQSDVVLSPKGDAEPSLEVMVTRPFSNVFFLLSVYVGGGGERDPSPAMLRLTTFPGVSSPFFWGGTSVWKLRNPFFLLFLFQCLQAFRGETFGLNIDFWPFQFFTLASLYYYIVLLYQIATRILSCFYCFKVRRRWSILRNYISFLLIAR